MKTITGQWSNAAGGTVRLELSKYALIGGTADNAPRFYQIFLDSSGSIPANYQVWANDELMPEGTTYKRTVFNAAGTIILGPDQILVCGTAPINLTGLIVTPPPPGVTVSISPAAATLTSGGTQSFTATVTPSTANQTVIWTATNGTINSIGLFTAAHVATATTAIVTATSVANPTVSASVAVSITVTVTVTISPGSYTLASGQSVTFHATVVGIANQAVTFSAVQGTITAAGGYTAPTVTTSTVDTVTATSVAVPSASASAQVSVSAPISVTVLVNPPGVTLNNGQTQQFTATVVGITNQSVTWSIAAGGIGIVSTTGLYTAPAIVPAQTVISVVATSVGYPSAVGLASITINAGGVPVVLVNPPGVTLNPGQTQQFTATVTNLVNQNVTWSLQPGTPGVPVAGHISSTGLYTAPTVETVQSFDTVVATSVGYPAANNVASVTINASGTPVVLVNPPGVTLNPGQTQQFTATITNLVNQAVTWSLQPGTPGVPVVGTISAGGLYTAPASLAVQSYDTVIATSVAYPPASNPALVTINAGGTTQLDLVKWMVLSTRSTHHLVGDPSAPYSVNVLDTDAIYPSNYPRGCIWQIKNKLGNPWDIHTYDSNWITHWITENGDAVDQAACQAANGTSCWLYSHAYKRYLTPVQIMPRFFTPHTTISHDNAQTNDVNRTTNCESTFTVVHIGPVRGITTGPFKISWGGSIDSGSGTLANGPNYDSVNGVDTIRVQYQYTGSYASGFADSEEYYYVLGFGEVAWYHYHNGVYQQKTVNTTLASGGAPVPNFPCGPGKSWFA